MRTLEVRHLGLIDYQAAIELQRRLVDARKADQIPDQLLLLEHPPVITLGARTRNDRSHVLATEEGLKRLGIALHDAGRGGDVTYHGPGQLVGYPILDLRPDRCDVHRYVRDLEEALILAVAGFGVTAGRVEGLTGVWVGSDKLAAMGVRISRWVTSHGFALNVAPAMAHFDLIVPCGLRDRGVTSLARLLPAAPRMEAVHAAVTESFGSVFGRRVVVEAPAAGPVPHP